MNNEPVAWMQTWENQDGDLKKTVNIEQIGKNDIPLYTHPAQKPMMVLDGNRVYPAFKKLTDEEWNKAFDFYCETDEGVLRFDLELRDEWKKEQLIRWKEALRKAQEK